MKNKRFIYILLAVLIFVGCKDKTPTYYVDKEMLRYCWFPEGSYWIYEEANTPGLLDSVYANDVSSRIVNDEDSGYKYEAYTIILNVQEKRRIQSILAWPGENESETLSELTESFSDPSGQQLDYLFFSHTSVLDTLTSYQTTIICNRHDSITIHGSIYLDAIEVCITPPQVADWTYNVIWVKDIGIVRRSLIDGKTWNLIRYHINN